LGQVGLENVLPETTQLLFTSQSIKTSYAMLEQTEICRQLSGPIWQSVVAKQKQSKVGSILNPRPWLGLDWQDISAMDQVGAVAAFLDGNGETAVMFLAKLGPNAEQHPFVQRWIENQGGMSRFQSSVIGNVKFYSLPVDAKTGVSACVAIGSQWTCISSSSKSIQQWLVSATAKSVKASAGSEAAKGIFATDGWANGETRFWLSPWALLNGFAKKEPKMVRSAKLFGMEGLGAMSGILQPPSGKDNYWRMSYSQQLMMPPAKGLAILNFKSGPMVEPPEILSDSMDQVSISYLDMKPWFQGVSHAADQMIDEETPGSFGDLVDSILTDPEGPKIDVRKELIYPSGPLMFSFGTTGPNKKKPSEVQHNQVWVCLLQDAKKASATINKLFENDKDIQSEQIGRYRVWNTIKDESLFVAVKKGDTQSISLAATDSTYLYLANDTAWFKGMISGAGISPKANARPLSLWKSYLPMTKSTPFSFRRAMAMGSWFESSWNRLPEPTQKEYTSVDLPSFCLTNVLVPGCAANEIPKWSQVRSAFGVLTQSAIQTERGIDGQVLLFASP